MVVAHGAAPVQGAGGGPGCPSLVSKLKVDPAGVPAFCVKIKLWPGLRFTPAPRFQIWLATGHPPPVLHHVVPSTCTVTLLMTTASLVDGATMAAPITMAAMATTSASPRLIIRLPSSSWVLSRVPWKAQPSTPRKHSRCQEVNPQKFNDLGSKDRGLHI